MKSKGHHYITESYQRNFANDDGMVWILTPESRVFPTNPENSFKENYFYIVKLEDKGSLIVEKTLGEIEGDFISSLRNITDNNHVIKEKDRLNMSMFVSSFLFRTKIQREHMRKSLMNVIEKGEAMKSAILNNPSKDHLPSSSSSGTSISLEELKQGMENFDEHHSMSVISSIEYNTPIICDMNWIILEAPEEKNYITSDNPLCMCSPEREKIYGPNKIGSLAGFAHADVELSFPLSKKFALVASWKYPEQHISATEKMVDQINFRTIRSSQNIIADNKDILEEILEKDISK